MGDALHAGIVRTADFLDMSDGDFDDVIDTNLKGVFIVSPSTQQQTSLLNVPTAAQQVDCGMRLSRRVPQSAALMLFTGACSLFWGCAICRMPAELMQDALWYIVRARHIPMSCLEAVQFPQVYQILSGCSCHADMPGGCSADGAAD